MPSGLFSCCQFASCVHEVLTCFAVRAGKPWRAVTDAGHVITRRLIKAVTDMRAVDSVMSRRTSVSTQCSYPAWQTMTLAGDQVTVCTVLTEASLIAVGAIFAFVTFCNTVTQRNIRYCPKTSNFHYQTRPLFIGHQLSGGG